MAVDVLQAVWPDAGGLVMATNQDAWAALASRLGQRLSGFPGSARTAVNSGASRFGRELGQFGRDFAQVPVRAGSAALDFGRAGLGAASAFGSALTSGVDPYEQAGPPTEMIQTPMPTFDDVRSGASTSAPPMMAPPPPVEEESPVVAQLPGGTIRYKLPGGQWAEFKGGDRAPTVSQGTISNPADPTRPHSYTPASGGGTVSMMTAPENAGVVTEASRAEDLTRQINERMARLTLEDPNWRERAKADAKVSEAIAIEQGKAQVQRGGQQAIMDDLAKYEGDVDSGLAEQVAQARQNPNFQRMPVEEQNRLIDAAASEAEETKRAYRERLGIATGNVSVSMRPSAGPTF